MKLFGRNLETEVAVIAEVGVNHEGDVEVARDILRAAASAGADAVKFQSYTPERFVGTGDQARFDRVTRFGLDEAAHRSLAQTATELGIIFFSAAITEDWVPLIAELSPVIKIASGDLTFEPVIRAAAATGRQMIISTGNGNVEEIDQAVAWVRDEVGEDALADRLALLHCIAAYPTPIEQANVCAVPFLHERYGLATGFSNHIIGPEAVLAAVALGASIIEVHVTDRNTGRDFHDHALSFEADGLRDLIDRIGMVKASLGVYDKQPMECEVGIREAIRKGVVAGTDLAAGTTLSMENMMYARPGSEFPSNEATSLVGKTIRRDIKRGKVIARDNIA
jgi:N,N'-diacetyllegionaminate synthase